jgi:hypothetical protein
LIETIGITVDCSEDGKDQLVDFWAAALGYQKVLPFYLVDPKGVAPRIAFQDVPEPKRTKNRWHLDLYVPDRQSLEPEVRRMVDLGATEIEHFDEPAMGFTNEFTLMLDPQGNEFCVCAPHLRVEESSK